jgi:hypothetical protein
MKIPDFSPATPRSDITYGIDFANTLVDRERITVVEWKLEVSYTAAHAPQVDTTPASKLLGRPDIVGGTLTRQRISGTLAGNTYLVTVLATLNNGQKLEVWCHLTCIEPM